MRSSWHPWGPWLASSESIRKGGEFPKSASPSHFLCGRSVVDTPLGFTWCSGHAFLGWMQRGHGGWGQPALKREGRFLAFLRHPMQVRLLCVMAQSCIFSIQWNLMFCFWFIMYASILLINYMCNCTIGTTASQRQHIIKLTLVVIELFRPWQDHWPLQGGFASTSEPVWPCLLPVSRPSPHRAPQGVPSHVQGGLPSNSAEPEGGEAWALGPRMPLSLFLCLCPDGYWPQSGCLVKTWMNKS